MWVKNENALLLQDLTLFQSRTKISIWHFNAIEKFLVQQPKEQSKKDSFTCIVAELAA